MLNTSLHIATLISLVGGFVVIFVKGQARLDKIKTRLKDAIRILKGLNRSNNLLVNRLLKEEILSADQFESIREPLREIPLDQLSELVGEMQPAGNPMTQEEHDQLQKYIDNIAEMQKEIFKEYEEKEKETYQLNVDLDALDFYYLARKFKEEYERENPETEEEKKVNQMLRDLLNLATFFASRHPELPTDEYADRFADFMESADALPEESEG